MTRITIDSTTAAQLAGLSGAVELVDTSGKTVGLFQPQVVRSTIHNTPNISNEDLDQYASETGGRTLPEIVRDLESQE